MKTLNEWIDYYQQKGIEVEPYNSPELDAAIGLRADIGVYDVRVLKFLNLSGRSSFYREVWVKHILKRLSLSEDYPWVTCTKNSVSIWFKSAYNGQIQNLLPLLWSGKEVLPCTHPNIYFFNGAVPKFGLMGIDYDLVLNCIESYKNELPIHNSLLAEDISVDDCVEIWPLKQFVEENGPKIEFGGYSCFSHNGEYYPICRIGRPGDWKYAYISLRMRDISASIIADKQDSLKIGRLLNGYYILYDTGERNWEPVIL